MAATVAAGTAEVVTIMVVGGPVNMGEAVVAIELAVSVVGVAVVVVVGAAEVVATVVTVVSVEVGTAVVVVVL